MVVVVVVVCNLLHIRLAQATVFYSCVRTMAWIIIDVVTISVCVSSLYALSLKVSKGYVQPLAVQLVFPFLPDSYKVN